MQPLIDIPLPSNRTKKLKWGQLSGTRLAYVISLVAQHYKHPLLVIANDTQHMYQLFESCRFFLPAQLHSPTLAIFPDWEILPYDHFSPHQDIVSDRLALLATIPNWHTGVLFTTVNTIVTRTVPVDFVQSHAFVMRCGMHIKPRSLAQQLQQYGYYSVSEVINHGEYAIRGSIFDIFPMGSNLAIRFDLLDDEIDSIRTFDPETQRTLDSISDIKILPAHEYPLDEKSIAHFRKMWRQNFHTPVNHCPIYNAISSATPINGIEYYLPLFFSQMSTLFDYLPNSTLILNTAEMIPLSDQFNTEVAKRYQQGQGNINRPILEPSQLFLSSQELATCINNFCHINVTATTLADNTGRSNFDILAIPKEIASQNSQQPLVALRKFLQPHSTAKIIFCAESSGRVERLLMLLKQININPQLCESWGQLDINSAQYFIIIAPLESGMLFKQSQLAQTVIVLTEADLLGQQVSQRRRRKNKDIDSELLIRNLNELTLHTPVVHLEHGIGRYLGLETLTVNEVAQEFLILAYHGGDKLYVPVTSLHLISRYSGVDIEHAPLHRLGSDQWDKAKQKAAKKVHDVAAELLLVEAKRQAQQGYAYTIPEAEYMTFASAFPFEETPDQEQAIEAVLKDLSNTQVTDRLICGDVGFGKTEVAMRAAFVVVHHSKQVAVLVPTTLLAQQHYENFCNRFANSAINIAVLSRFNTAKQQTQVLHQLAAGDIDIIVGTHKLLQPIIRFKDLGLIIIDEEHRFGVRHKERLKKMCANIDILTLTATPIPRTLNMAMSGMRDISLITTPPAKRLAIKTFVYERSHTLIREAILREILRGGQIYFLHNKVATIEKTAAQLADLIPEARIKIAHGQMAERHLEATMNEFYHQQFNVLVCTTIIETGIDIPTANTIVIDRADCFGLGQLHQLRGRVGRSHHQAYAYLLTPHAETLSQDAQQRLEVIASMEDLGAGFNLASHDLEIRGAGELLGNEQSGHIQEIGFSLYMELLKRTVTALKAGEDISIDWNPSQGCEIDLKITTLIPEDYVADVHLRLVLYKRIANCRHEHEISDIEVEMIDRFGKLPSAVKNLLQISHLKLQSEHMGIKKVLLHSRGGHIEFNQDIHFKAEKLIQLIQNQAKQYQMTNATRLKIRCESLLPEQRIAFLENLYKELS